MNNLSPWNLNHLDQKLIDLALEEDLGLPFNDLTSALLFSKNNPLHRATVISKNPHPVILCGLQIVQGLLAKWDEQCVIQSEQRDGDVIQPGATLLTIKGPAQILLMVERTLLNFLQHLCAIATYTAKFVALIKHTNAKILDTRKTLPGFRHLDKYAVQCGGGVNHRMGLYDAIMLKDTHVDFLGGMEAALAVLPSEQTVPVIIEVRSLFELEIVLTQARHKISRVLLDNMQPSQLKECVKLCRDAVATEASGNISLNNIAEVAESGVDFISVGQITHSAAHVDLSMKCAS